ncbi:MAG TPA: ATP-binding protein [Nitrospiraceae bacterium]|jgi:signal transduction histidine kinase|nr:ATP-binding protein [Nitrospiraceae bacterium]
MERHPHPCFVSLRTKFVVLSGLIIVATTSSVSWYFVQEKRAAMTERLTGLGSVLVKNLEHTAHYAVISEDRPTLATYMDGVMEVDEVVYVVITGSDGTILAAKSKGHLTSRPDFSRFADQPLYPDPSIASRLRETSSPQPRIVHLRDRDGESFYDFALPVVQSSREKLRSDALVLQSEESLHQEQGAPKEPVYGVIQIGLSEVKLQRALTNIVKNVVLITLAIIAAGIVGTLLLTARIITPLRSLTRVAQRVAEGDLTASATPTTRDEVGQLTLSFNQMTESLKERDQAISVNLDTIRHQVNQLTTLNQASAVITSTLDLDKLLTTVLHLLIDNLGFARTILILYDSERGIAYAGRVAGVPPDVERKARALEISVQDNGSLDADLLLHGKPVLALNIETVAQRMHPPMLELAREIGVISFVAVPLRSKQRILGYLAADRGLPRCTQEDFELLMTVASHVAVALDNARAYLELELLTQTLEKRVQERTQELQRINDQLEEEYQRRMKLMRAITHDMRTPLTSITGFVDNMLDLIAGPLTERQAGYLKRAKNNLTKLKDLTEQLPAAINPVLRPEQLALGVHSLFDMVADAVDNQRVTADKKGVALHISRADNLSPVRVDRNKIERVIMNLVNNAVKFTPSGGEVHIRGLVRDDGFWEICIADTGCGIPEEEIPKLFEETVKLKSPLPDEQGSHLGLPICKQFVELHGGQIWVESRLGEGSRFFFTLPLERQAT